MILLARRHSIVADGYLRRNSPRDQTMGMALPVPQFTIEMLDTLPDDGNRYELLEGMLLVTPAPSSAHQIVATRLATILGSALQDSGKAHVVAVGAVQRGTNTQFQPDILVFPTSFRPGADWRTIRGWWLAIEVMSPSSRVYDREVKRAAYLALGVEEYWLVDMRDHSIEVWTPGSAEGERATRALVWRPAGLAFPVVVNLEQVFQDVSE